jgi:4-amino-4-deoxy-L-arabinose transferase-like glycosyltransferase
MLGVLALVALAVRLHSIGWGLPEVYEEAYPFKSAWDMWGWGPGREFSLHPRFFRYPSLTFYLQFIAQAVLFTGMWITGQIHSAIDFRVLYELDKTPFYVTGRTITALFGAATAPLVAVIARRIALAGGAPRDGSTFAAVIAGLATALNGPLIAKSQEIEVDVPLTCLVAVAVLIAFRLLERPSLGNSLWMGIVVGLATSTKYTGLIVLIPGVVALLWSTRALPRSSRARFLVTRTGVLLGAALAALLLTSPFLVIDYTAFLRDLTLEREHQELGHFGVAVGSARAYYLSALVSRGLGWPLTLAALGGVLWLAINRLERHAAIVAVTSIVYLVIVGSWSMKAERYLLPILPLLMVLAAAFLARLMFSLPSRWPGAVRRSIAAACALLMLGPLLPGLPEAWARAAPDTRTRARSWIEAHVAPGAFVVTEPYGPVLMSSTRTVEMQPDVVAEIVRRKDRPPLYAVVPLPMFQVKPERSADFYDLELFRDADLFVITGSVRDRHAEDSARFAAQMRFYQTLELDYRRLAEFRSQGGPGPTITLYGPKVARWEFASRDSVLGPGRYRGAYTSSETFFYLRMGMAYEAAGHFDWAAVIYAEGLSHPPGNDILYRRLAQREGHCLLRARTLGDARTFAAGARAAATHQDCASAWEWIESELASRTPWFAAEGLTSFAFWNSR